MSTLRPFLAALEGAAAGLILTQWGLLVSGTPADARLTLPREEVALGFCFLPGLPESPKVRNGSEADIDVALLGTRFTMSEPYVRERIERRGISFVGVDPGWTREVDRIIFDELAAGRVVRDSQRKLKSLITELAKQKVQAVVLGCTELVLAVDVRANVIPVYDTTAIHARAAVEWMLSEEEEARAAA